MVIIDSIFEKKPVLDKSITMSIKPISAVSITNTASNLLVYSSSELEIKIMAMVENMLGIHTTDEIRRPLIKKVGKYVRKNKNGFIPLIHNIIDIKIDNLEEIDSTEGFFDVQNTLCKYSDNRHIRGMKSKTDEHIRMLKTLKIPQSGTVVLPTLNDIPTDLHYLFDQGLDEDDNTCFELSIKRIFNTKPINKFYTSMYKREYKFIEKIDVRIQTTQAFHDLIKTNCIDDGDGQYSPINNNMCIGNSESLVDISLKFN